MPPLPEAGEALGEAFQEFFPVLGLGEGLQGLGEEPVGLGQVLGPAVGPAEAFPKVYSASLSLKDEKSFIPRLAGSGDWVLSYDGTCSPLGAALMRHLCVRVGNLGVGASQSLVEVLGGDTPSLDGAKASWNITTDGGSNLVKSFKVSSASPGAEKTDVGQLVLKLEEPAKPAAK